MSYTEKPDSCFCPGPSGFLELQITGRESGWTAGQLLRKRLGFSKKQISRLKFRESGILVNGERQRVNVLLKEGDILKVGLAEGSRSGKVEPCPGHWRTRRPPICGRGEKPVPSAYADGWIKILQGLCCLPRTGKRQPRWPGSGQRE